MFDRPIENGQPSLSSERTIVVDVPEDVALRHEWLEEPGIYRRFLIPARIINPYLGERRSQ